LAVDPTGPTGGSLLANLIQTPSLMERAQQGREVGYAIIAVGIIAVLFAFYKLYSLYMIGTAVRKQAGQDAADPSNPLGRVLKVGKDNFDKDIDTLELKLAEAIMAERPAIDQGIGFIKIISVIAPLAGIAWNCDRYDCYFPNDHFVRHRRSKAYGWRYSHRLL
jgi:biopolymer transport protein ExbB